MLASIPSPSSESWDIGNYHIRYYGVIIAVGIIVAIWFIGRRLVKREMNPEIAVSLAWAAVPGGLIGARLYHVITDWEWGSAWRIWEGGLGIPGAIIGGVGAGWLLAFYKGWSIRKLLDIAAPALLAAQSIGRLGNWVNQELYGGPTDLPWGLEIDSTNRPIEHFMSETFHPAFLYEIIWMLILMGVLLWIDKLRKLPIGSLFALYVLGYASGRIALEFVRIDPATELLGLRINVWVMSVLWIGAAVAFYLNRNQTTWAEVVPSEKERIPKEGRAGRVAGEYTGEGEIKRSVSVAKDGSRTGDLGETASSEAAGGTASTETATEPSSPEPNSPDPSSAGIRE